MFKTDISFIHKYFMAEKQAGLLFLCIGSVAVIVSVLFFFFLKSNPSFFKGAAIPLILIGLVQLVVGYSIYFRSDNQRKEVAYQAGLEPVAFVKNTELPRMHKVMSRFKIYLYAEIILLVAGIALFIYFGKLAPQPFWKGIGLTLAIMALLSMGADYLAEKRGKLYTQSLQQLLPH